MDNEQLELIRHTAAHILAAALLELYPGTKLGFGPATENGFYYDVLPPEGTTISEDDLPRIQERMEELIAQNDETIGEQVSVDQARAFAADQPFKMELIDQLEEQGDPITIYTTGAFKDLCRGGHAERTKQISVGGLQLNRIAGAYWRGDEQQPMMTRISGLLFENKKALKQYLARIEEAKKRDHRKLGKELDLFLFSEKVGPGLPLWSPKGTLLRTLLDDFVWSLRKERGFEKVEIPHVTKKDLYIASGHWDKFEDELFRIETREGHDFAMKPMNCPHHTQIFDRKPMSYREMPQRYANTTMIYRDEQTGELHGLSRVRSITQDDAHVFCRESQIQEEIMSIWDIVEEFYTTLGFTNLSIRLSLSDPENQDAYLGSAESWKLMESAIRDIVQLRGKEAVEAIGEAAFYGPKIDFMAQDSIGREWQVATIQIDKNQPEGFDLNCINEDGEKERITMIHAAVMGSIERFLSIYIEHTAGRFPAWLAPVQVTLLPVSDRHEEHCHTVAAQLREHGIRTDVDMSGDTVGKKIRNAAGQAIPYQVVIGDNEVSGEPLSIRIRGQKEQISLPLQDFIAHIAERVKQRSLEL